MFQVKCSLVLRQMTRCSLGALRENSSSANVSRESRFLKKFLTNAKKRVWHENRDTSSTAAPKKLVSTFKENKNASRRVTVLNKLFMRHVTDLMSSSHFSGELAGLGIQISHVKVVQNFHGLNVFWYSSCGNDKIFAIEKRLAELAHPIRHQLSQLRLMGEVPHIRFVKDAQLTMENEVAVLLQTADYGDDYVPTTQRQRVKEQFDLIGDGDRSDMPPMRNDLYGVDWSKIMGRLQIDLRKVKNAWEEYEQDTLNRRCTGDTFEAETSFQSLQQSSKEQMDTMEDSKALQEFLSRRKREKRLKHNHIQTNFVPDSDYSEYQEEWENDTTDYFDDAHQYID